jgi:hypothetical protein
MRSREIYDKEQLAPLSLSLFLFHAFGPRLINDFRNGACARSINSRKPPRLRDLRFSLAGKSQPVNINETSSRARAEIKAAITATVQPPVHNDPFPRAERMQISCSSIPD